MKNRKFFSFLNVSCIGIAFALMLSACNTVKGVGEDMEAGGQAMQKAAEKNSH